MTTHPSHRIVCLLGAFVVSTGLAQEIVPSKAIPSSSVTNHLPVVGVFPGPNWDVRYDVKKPVLRFDVSTPVQTKPEGTRWRRDVESAERENLRLMNDYRSRAAALATPHVQPQFHPSAVEDILNRLGR